MWAAPPLAARQRAVPGKIFWVLPSCRPLSLGSSVTPLVMSVMSSTLLLPPSLISSTGNNFTFLGFQPGLRTSDSPEIHCCLQHHIGLLRCPALWTQQVQGSQPLQYIDSHPDYIECIRQTNLTKAILIDLRDVCSFSCFFSSREP